MNAAERLEVTVQLNKPQREQFANLADHHTLFLGWGRGVGKSKFIRLLWWMLIAQHEYKLRRNALSPFRGIRVTVLMPTLKQFKDVHWSGILDELTGEWAWLGAKLDRTTGQITFPGGSTVKPFPASEYNARTALGLRTDVLVIDECDDVPAIVYDAVALPWLSEPWSLGIQIVAGTPNKGRHGLWWRTYQQGLLGARLRAGEELPPEEGESPLEHAARADAFKTIFASHATYRDAPETVSPRAVAKARAVTPAATFKREWEADPDAGEGLVYAFDAEFHVREAPPLSSFAEFVVGMDHGTVDAGVLLLGGIQGHGADARLWILEEHYESGIPNHIWDDRAKAWRFAKFWPDTSRADRIQDLRSFGLNVGETDRGPGSILAGIARVADLLFVREIERMGPAFQPIVERSARLYVAPDCKNTIREFGLYRRKRLPDGTFDEDPEDRNNHAMDALRYMALGRFGRMPNQRHESPR